MNLTVYVHISLPVVLAYAEPPTVEQVRRDTIASLPDHPALQHPAKLATELGYYVDKIVATGPDGVLVFE